MPAQRKLNQSVILTVCLAMITLLPGQASSQISMDLKTYAKACMAALSDNEKKPIDFPALLQCDDADSEILPITKDGKAIPAQTNGDGSNFTSNTDCDRPPLLGLNGKIGQCVPNSRLRITQVAQVGVEDKNRPYYALLCRNYQYRSLDSQKNKPEYDDIALIVYSAANHSTCFFQRLKDPQIRDVPRELSAFPIVDAVSGRDIPSPFGADAGKFWNTPEVVQAINCARCHDANPFVRSPYAYQVAKGKNKLPTRDFGDAYKIVALDEFGAEWKKFHAYFNLKHREKGRLGACLQCHSLGPGLSSGDFTNYSAGILAPNQFDSTNFALTHWMPPGADKKTWEKDYGDSVGMITVCNKAPESCPQIPLH